MSDFSGILIPRDLITIKTKEEVDFDNSKRNNEAINNTVKHILKDIKSTINNCCESGHEWFIHNFIDDEIPKDIKDRVIEIVIFELVSKGYGVNKHKVIGENIISVVLKVPFDNVKLEIDKYIKQYNKNNMIILGMFSLIIITIAVMILSCFIIQ